MVTTVSTNTFLTDLTILIRDQIASAITDPISAKRASIDKTSKFVMTSYPARAAVYPLITIRNTAITGGEALGGANELHYTNMRMEIRVWGTTETEKVELTQQVINTLRSIQLSTTIPANIYDFDIIGAFNVDEPGNEKGEGGIRSKIITISYNFILGV